MLPANTKPAPVGAAPAAVDDHGESDPKSSEASTGKPEAKKRREQRIDAQSEQSFPASDPPSWTLGND